MRNNKKPHLTERQVRKIYRAVRNGTPWQWLGVEYGVHNSTIYRIITGETWSRITGVTKKQAAKDGRAESSG